MRSLRESVYILTGGVDSRNQYQPPMELFAFALSTAGEWTATKLGGNLVVPQYVSQYATQCHWYLRIVTSNVRGTILLFNHPQRAYAFLTDTSSFVELPVQGEHKDSLHPLIVAERLFFSWAGHIFVYALEGTLSAPLATINLSSLSPTPIMRCFFRANTDSTVTIVGWGSSALVLQLNSRGEQVALINLKNLNFTASTSVDACFISGDNIVLGSKNGNLHWISISKGKVVMDEKLHDTELTVRVVLFDY